MGFQLLQVLVLLCKLSLELHQLLLLTHANGVILIGLLALGECVPILIQLLARFSICSASRTVESSMDQ